MRKIFSLVLVLCLVFNCVSVLAGIEEDFAYTYVKDGSYIEIMHYIGDNEVVVIPDSINGFPVRVIERFSSNIKDDTTTKEVIIPDSVWEIGEYAFGRCVNLEKVTISGSVTVIGRGAFEMLDNLKEVNLYDGLIEIGESAFYSCDSLTELYIPKTVKSVGKNGDFRSAFADGELKNLKINVDPHNEYYMSDENGWVYTKDGKTLLMSCHAGKTVTIPQGVTEINDKVFYGCNEIQEVILPTTLEKIGKWAFCGCADIKKLELPNSLKYIEEKAFSNCWWLTELTFGENMEYIGGGAFFGCANLKNVTFLNPYVTITEFSQYKDMASARQTIITTYGAFHLSGVEVVNCYIGSTAYNYFKDKNIVPIIKIETNGNMVKTDSIPYIKNDRTMVPMRAIFEALGATVTWDDMTKTAIGVKGDTEVKIAIGENVLYKNGEATLLDAAAEITNDRTMVPVRAISEAFGCTVNWNDETKTVEITN